MKLFITKASPFARKARIAIFEKHLNNVTEEIEVLPTTNPKDLPKYNPIKQVPTLVLDNGMVVFDSSLICAYANEIGTGANIYGENILETRRLETISNAILEMMVKLIQETRRDKNERSDFWIERWAGNIHDSLKYAEAQISNINQIDSFNMGEASIAIAMTYGDFRYKEIMESLELPKLRALQEKYEARESFKATYPQ